MQKDDVPSLNPDGARSSHVLLINLIHSKIDITVVGVVQIIDWEADAKIVDIAQKHYITLDIIIITRRVLIID